MTDHTDIVIIGAGSAGATLAARLSEDPHLRVTLIEAGPRHRNPWIDIPIGYFKTVGDPQVDWGFQTEPEPGMADRRLPWPRGKGLGGTSLINGMLYLRGHQKDYDHWAALGNPGWSWQDVLPAFKRSMDAETVKGPADAQGGPLGVADIPPDVLSDRFIQAAIRCGVPQTQDFNQGDNTGAGYYRMTTRRGARESVARAFLEPVMSRSNLNVLTDARVLCITVEGGRATGVVLSRNGQQHRIIAAQEVVVAAGALQTPQLLMLSGLGPASHLRAQGLAVQADLPGVGANLQDHLQVRPSFQCKGVETLNDIANSRWRSAREFIRYKLTRQGTLRNGVYRAGAFLSLPPTQAPDWPNIQIHFGLVSFDRPHTPPHPFPGVTLSACLLRPESRGRITLASTDPLAAPRIEANYLSDSRDQALAVAAIRKMREIAAQPSMAGLIVREHEPGTELVTDAQLLDWARKRGGSIFHPVGTCAMGPDSDPMAVVDHRLRVRGVTGLRVVDGSIMPRVVSGNTNAPIIMIAERAAELIRDDIGAASVTV